MEKKLKRLLIALSIAVVGLIVVTIAFGERISDFMSGFVTGIALTFIVGFILYVTIKIQKKRESYKA